MFTAATRSDTFSYVRTGRGLTQPRKRSRYIFLHVYTRTVQYLSSRSIDDRCIIYKKN